MKIKDEEKESESSSMEKDISYIRADMRDIRCDIDYMSSALSCFKNNNYSMSKVRAYSLQTFVYMVIGYIIFSFSVGNANPFDWTIDNKVYFSLMIMGALSFLHAYLFLERI